MSDPFVVVDQQGSLTGERCQHLDQVQQVPDPAAACADCLAEGTRWVHLRQCLTCGGTRCCDSSPRRHATAHQHASGHPLVRSAQPGEDWAWCYPEELFLLSASP